MDAVRWSSEASMDAYNFEEGDTKLVFVFLLFQRMSLSFFQNCILFVSLGSTDAIMRICILLSLDELCLIEELSDMIVVLYPLVNVFLVMRVYYCVCVFFL